MGRKERPFVFRFFRFVIKIKLIFNRKERKVFTTERTEFHTEERRERYSLLGTQLSVLSALSLRTLW